MIYENFEETETVQTDKNVGLYTITIIIAFFYLIWVITGLLAFLTSLICFAFYGTTSDKFLGLIIALIIGPFYWLYFIFNNTGYCSRSPPTAF